MSTDWLTIATVGDTDYYRVFDGSGEDYLYGIDNPKPWDSSCDGGRWEIVEGMTEEEEELFRKFKEHTEPFNDLVDQSMAIAARYSKLYRKEIDAYTVGLNDDETNDEK